MSTLTKNSEAGAACEPEAIVRQLMRQRIDHYVATRSDPSLYQSVRNMSQLVSDDYGNRFLIELIQNAHDAHDPARDDGEIEIVLDATDGDFGCLYVANRGIGFTPENLKAITNIALSNKPVNAGIGNKGLGFAVFSRFVTGPRCSRFKAKAGVVASTASASDLQRPTTFVSN